MGIVDKVRRGLRHTRIVPSGSPPLYRLNLLGLLISGIISAAIGEAPTSVEETASQWYSWSFIIGQLIATTMVLIGLYSEDGSSEHAAKLRRSLATEFTGLVFLQTVIIINVVAVMFMNTAPPAAPSSWLMIMFGSWIGRTRMPEIWRAIKELQ